MVVTFMIALMFNGGQNGHVMEVASLLEGEWSSYKRWSVECRENDHVTDFIRLMEGE